MMAKRTKQQKEMTRSRKFRRGAARVSVHLLVWSGIAVIYYFVFSFFFDTPAELRLRTSTHRLAAEYDILNARYDSLMEVLDNVAERDRSVFRTLFESDPYDFADIAGGDEWMEYERLRRMDNRALAAEFFARLGDYQGQVRRLDEVYSRMSRRAEQMGEGVDHIPSIQPIVNHELTLLTASFGLLIHPFYRTLMPHGGVDYTVPEGTHVFATADGTVKSISTNNTGGRTVVLSHGGGYETTYSHLSSSRVKAGQSVRRGDVIALTGDTGLSLAPHLHYEVRKDGMRVDPIHYFFMELSPDRYQRIIRIAGSGMQSFD